MNRFYIVLLIFAVGFSVNDIEKQTRKIFWKSNIQIDSRHTVMSFEGCEYPDYQSFIPYYIETIPLSNKSFHVEIENEIYELVEKSEFIFDKDNLPQQISIESSVIKSGNEKSMQIMILPLKKENNKIYKLIGFDLKFVPQNNFKNAEVKNQWDTQSVLSSGNWVKIKTTKKGIHKIAYSKLQDWGFSTPENVSIFGNGGYMLSESNNQIEHDDLEQVSVWKGKDGSGNDCLFFYSPGNTKWSWDETEKRFEHEVNVYTSSTFYFLTDQAESEKLVSAFQDVTSTPTHSTTSFNDYSLHEVEKYNLIESGKRWFGEKFIDNLSLSFSMNCNNRVTSEPAKLKVVAAGRYSSPSSMSCTVDGNLKATLNFDSVNIDSGTEIHAKEDVEKIEVSPTGETMNVAFKYNAGSTSAEAWLDYVEMNYRRNLQFSDSELYFRDAENIGYNNIVEYTVQNSSSNLKVFDVTELNSIFEVPTIINGSTIKFVRPADELREYVVFNPAGSFSEPEKVGTVSNQNLHGLTPPDFVIIAHPDFINAAQELASFHQSVDGMTVEVVKSTQIYNEFSSGMPDATGIRNFLKMLYERGGNLKYVLLLGDGSYDNRNIEGEGKNFIPTFQSENSLLPTYSFVSDDFFVILDNGETVYNGAVDLGIGRIPASSTYEASSVVNKIKNYYNTETFGIWRNTLCFIGDDEDTNVHMEQSENLSNQVNAGYGAFIINKVYFDAYTQESTGGVEKYPEVTKAINENVENGVLILNYVGHANNRYLAHEQVLNVSDINSWSNSNNLPIFVTATCEFSRYDANLTSAGEYILFNPNGGGIGLFSTTRVVYSHLNEKLSINFYKYVFEKDANGDHYRMGDIMRLAKVATNQTVNKRNFSLLADPVLKLSYPRYNVVTNTINQKDANAVADTVGAMSKVIVTGHVADFNGNKLSDFNGKITPVVYDKAFMMETLGNAGTTPMQFKVQNSIVYKGLASVVNGDFTFEFVIPKDISYNLGEGKIVYYAENGEDDAHGAFENFYIGTSSQNQITDNQGPQVELYLDDTSFKSGDETSRNPLLLAYISDENGINTVGTGIGHDITAILDNDYSSSIVFNEYYQADIDDYKSGKIEYQFSDLSIGEHTLKLKVWDVANNSTEVEIDFIVTSDFQIEEISNYPNPVSEYTSIVFKHNQPDATFKSIIEVFDKNGRVVDSFTENITSNGMYSNPVYWETSGADSPLRSGLYFYRVTIKSTDGAVTSKTGKMTVVR